jgi:hypothetical protein
MPKSLLSMHVLFSSSRPRDYSAVDVEIRIMASGLPLASYPDKGARKSR